jgi:hypothetical protein
MLLLIGATSLRKLKGMSMSKLKELYRIVFERRDLHVKINPLYFHEEFYPGHNFFWDTAIRKGNFL